MPASQGSPLQSPHNAAGKRDRPSLAPGIVPALLVGAAILAMLMMLCADTVPDDTELSGIPGRVHTAIAIVFLEYVVLSAACLAWLRLRTMRAWIVGTLWAGITVAAFVLLAVLADCESATARIRSAIERQYLEQDWAAETDGVPPAAAP